MLFHLWEFSWRFVFLLTVNLGNKSQRCFVKMLLIDSFITKTSCNSVINDILLFEAKMEMVWHCSCIIDTPSERWTLDEQCVWLAYGKLWLLLCCWESLLVSFSNVSNLLPMLLYVARKLCKNGVIRAMSICQRNFFSKSFITGQGNFTVLINIVNFYWQSCHCATSTALDVCIQSLMQHIKLYHVTLCVIGEVCSSLL